MIELAAFADPSGRGMWLGCNRGSIVGCIKIVARGCLPDVVLVTSPVALRVASCIGAN